jgi:hypothetical protein
MSESAKVKRPVGRPTKYKPEYCERVIALGKEGYSHAELAADLEVDKASLYDWAAAHEEFSTALRAAKTYEQAWFEREARSNMKNRDFNANLWYRSAASRFREDYTERKETQLTGANGGAVQVETKSKIDVKALDPDQREALKNLLLAAKKEGANK